MIALALKYRRLIAYGLLLAAIVGAGLYLRHSGKVAGMAQVQALWDADTAARDKATAEAIAEVSKREIAALANNAEVLEDANAKLAAIAADRDSLYGMLQRARGEVRSLAAAEATGRLGLDVATGIAARASEAEAAIRVQWDRYDAACQRDGVRFQALQDQLRPQIVP